MLTFDSEEFFVKFETSVSVKIAVALKCQRDVQLRAIILCTLQFASFCREAVSQLQQTVLGATHSVLVERVGKICRSCTMSRLPTLSRGN